MEPLLDDKGWPEECYIECGNCGEGSRKLLEQVNCGTNSNDVCFLCRRCSKSLVLKSEWLNTDNARETSDKGFALQCENCPNKDAELFDWDLMARDVLFCLCCNSSPPAVTSLSTENRANCPAADQLPVSRRSSFKLHRTIITREDIHILSPGDHVAWHRKHLIKPINHHGIVESIDIVAKTLTVIERSKLAFRKGSVRRKTLLNENDFKSMYRYDYEQDECLPLEVTLDLARKHLHEDGYDLLTRNCEHFATFCKTGRGVCGQLFTVAIRGARTFSSAFLQGLEELVPWLVPLLLREADIVKTLGSTATFLGRETTKLMQIVKIGTTAGSIALNVVIEVVWFVYHIYGAYKQYKNGKISPEDFKRELCKHGWESGLSLFLGIGLGLFGMFLLPGIGVLLGSVGFIGGSLIGKLIGKKISEDDDTEAPAIVACNPVALDSVALDSVALDPVALDPVALDPVVLDPVTLVQVPQLETPIPWQSNQPNGSTLCYVECIHCGNDNARLFCEESPDSLLCLCCMKRLYIPEVLAYDRECAEVYNYSIQVLDEQTGVSVPNYLRESTDVCNPTIESTDVCNSAIALSQHNELTEHASDIDPWEMLFLAPDTSSKELFECYIECGECYNSDAGTFGETFENDKLRIKCLKCHKFLQIPTFKSNNGLD